MIIMTKFDLNKELNDLSYPNMFKAGLKYYISANNIKIKNKKEFDKIVEEYGNMNIGG